MDVFVRKSPKGKYWSREEVEKHVRGGKEALRQVPEEVKADFLGDDYTKGKGKDRKDFLYHTSNIKLYYLKGVQGKPR